MDNQSQRSDHVVKEIVLEQGMEIDVTEAWEKLISSQFGGDPGRGFGELVQNFLDSYPASTPWEDRRGEIITGKGMISLADYGEGMDRKRLMLLLTLGGTDKSNDVGKIGTFGVGFFSIFNPRLGTQKVTVTTRCEGCIVELVFKIREQGELPDITTRILPDEIPFSTKIVVFFNRPDSVQKCLTYAGNCLMYYPCKMIINGSLFTNIWAKAEKKQSHIFKQGYCDGILDINERGHWVDVLCKYEHIIKMSFTGLITGGHLMNYDLRDYKAKEIACLPKEKLIINCNNLHVTISRDSFKLDHAYSNMLKVVKEQMLLGLQCLMDQDELDREVILANQYIFARRLGTFLRRKEKGPKITMVEERVYTVLVETKIYRLNNEEKLYSLRDLRLMRSKGVPFFFSPRKDNVNWLGGNFKHDFIVLPPICKMKSGAPGFHETIFSAAFGDIVNLDSVREDEDKLDNLVQRGIVPKKLLEQKVEITGERELTAEELDLVEELSDLLAIDTIKDIVCRQLKLTYDAIRVAMIEFHNQGAVIATGLFDSKGRPVNNRNKETRRLPTIKTDDDHNDDERTILVGLNRNSDLIQSLIGMGCQDRGLFMLPILANELTMNQKWFAPHSNNFNNSKEKLASEIRRGLLEALA